MASLRAGIGRQLIDQPTRHIQVPYCDQILNFTSVYVMALRAQEPVHDLPGRRNADIPPATKFFSSLQVPGRAAAMASPDVERPKLIYISSTAPSHDRLGHPECAARGAAILDALQANEITPEALPGQVCWRLPSL